MGRLIAVLTALLLVAPAAPAAADDVPNTTCRIDAVAEVAGVDAQISCLQLDVETYGEFDAAATVTLQVATDDGWEDLSSFECTGRSVQGVFEHNCHVVNTGVRAGDDVRGLIDLDAPQDWPPAIADPLYTGGSPVADALAEDECDVNEAHETYDLTAPDAPWADLCGVTMSSQVTGELTSVTIATHVAALRDERTPTTTWVAQLRGASGCGHTVSVAEDGVIGEAAATFHTGCDYEPAECSGISKLITDLTGGGCAASGAYAEEETVVLPADAVSFSGDEITVTVEPDDLPALAAADFAPGATIESASAWSHTGLGSGDGRIALDYDFAGPTGRTHTIGE
jgi:hypothetical protein